MARYLKQSTTANIKMGPFLDDTDGKTAEAALTPTVKVSKAGGTMAARSSATATSHDADGYYTVELDATDTGTLGRLRVTATASGALPVWEDFVVLHANVYDVLFGSVAPSTHTAAAVQALVAAGAVASVTGAVGSVTGNVGGNVVGSVASVTAGVTLAAATHTGAVIPTVTDLTNLPAAPTDWLSAAAVSAAAAVKIEDAVWAGMPTGDSITAIAEGVRDVDNTTPAADSLGESINSAASAGDPWSTTLPGSYGAGTAGKIIGDNLNATVSSRASQSSVDTIDGIVDAILVDTGTDIPATLATLATAAALTTVDDLLDTEVAAIKTVVDAVKAKTDNLPVDPADASDIAASFTSLNTKVDTIDDLIDTEVGAIKAVTDKLNDTLELDSTVYRFTVNALEQAPVGGGGGSTDWTSDERAAIRTILGVPATGTTPDVPSAGALWVIDDLIDTEIAAIKAKTDNLPASFPANFAALDINASGHVARVVLSDTVTTLTNLPAITTDWITAAGVSAAAVTKIQTGLSTGDTPGTTTLLSRLTSQRATNLDNLDATISSRADAATALSDLTWTDAKAAFLDASITGITTGGVSADEIAEAVVTEINTTGVNLAATGLDAIPVTLTGQPTNFREWMVWLCRRFVRVRRVKATGILSVYGSNGTSVVTNQVTTDNATEQTTGAFQ